MMYEQELKIISEGTTWRTGMIFHMATAISGGAVNGELYDLLADGDLDEHFPFLKQYLDPSSEDEDKGFFIPQGHVEKQEAIIDAFMSKPNQKYLTGFLVKIECPVFERSAAGNLRYSWGYTQSEWFLCNTVEDIINAGEGFEQRLRGAIEQAA